MSRIVQIANTITVGTLAEKLDIPVSKLIGELMKNGVMATVNERVDFDTASIVVGEIEDLDVNLELEKEKSEATHQRAKPKSGKGQARPPVVAVMGHVDHGKTSLLDAICDAKTAQGEAGGITQHISAYQAKHGDRVITFLDTPGHEAFAAIREHGAHLTDLVILVVAADDGIKPQTVEAIRFAKKAGVKIIVAINKIDKEGADANRIKQQLAEHELTVEEWGGETVVVEVSAKAKTGIDKLLDMVILVADLEDLKAEVTGPATGLIIEAHMEKGRGPIGVALVESGILKQGDTLMAGSTYAKVRNLESPLGDKLEKAEPSTPVVLTGFKTLPRFGDEFTVVKNEKEARSLLDNQARNQSKSKSQDISGGELIRMIDKQKQVSELHVVVKADVQGSLKSVIDSLRSLNTEEVAIRIVGSDVGNINEMDVHLAATSQAIIYGFNVEASAATKKIANRDQVSLRTFKIIYELIEDCKNELNKLLKPEIVRTDLGRLIVKGIFKVTKDEVICGGEVTKGKAAAPSKAAIFREDKQLADVEITKLQRGPQEAKEVPSGEMCGVSFNTENRVDLQEGDKLEFYTEETITRKL